MTRDRTQTAVRALFRSRLEPAMSAWPLQKGGLHVPACPSPRAGEPVRFRIVGVLVWPDRLVIKGGWSPGQRPRHAPSRPALPTRRPHAPPRFHKAGVRFEPYNLMPRWPRTPPPLIQHAGPHGHGPFWASPGNPCHLYPSAPHRTCQVYAPTHIAPSVKACLPCDVRSCFGRARGK